MWARIAEEMQVPWRTAEAMHWHIGETDMARRAGVVPFSLISVSAGARAGSGNGGVAATGPAHRRGSPARGHTQSQTQAGVPRGFCLPSPRHTAGSLHNARAMPRLSIPPSYTSVGPLGGERSMAHTRQESIARGSSARSPYGLPDPGEFGPPLSAPVAAALTPVYGPLAGVGPGFTPIEFTGPGIAAGSGRGNLLPSLAELTTGVSPYSTPAYSAGQSSLSPVTSIGPSPAPFLPAPTSYPHPPPPLTTETVGTKRRRSPDNGSSSRETGSSRRRHLEPRSRGGAGGSSSTRRG